MSTTRDRTHDAQMPLEIESAYVRLLARFAEREGVDLALLAARAGLTPHELRHREAAFPFPQTRQLILAAQRAIARPTLALEAGLHTDTTAHGPLSQLMSSCRDLRQGLAALEAYMQTRTRNVQVCVRPAHGGQRLELRSRRDTPDIQAFILDYAAAAVSGLLRIVAGGGMDGVRLDLSWSAPSWSNAYQRLAGQVRFRQPCLAFWLPDAILDQPNPTAARTLYHQAVQHAEQTLARLRSKPSLTDTVRAALERGGRDGWPTEAQLAASLGMSRRGLVGRLRQEHTTFQSLLDQCRCDQASWHLRYTHLPVAEIASLLGYKDASNFSRSFRRLAGVTPSAFRARRGVAGGEGGAA